MAIVGMSTPVEGVLLTVCRSVSSACCLRNIIMDRHLMCRRRAHSRLELPPARPHRAPTAPLRDGEGALGCRGVVVLDGHGEGWDFFFAGGGEGTGEGKVNSAK